MLKSGIVLDVKMMRAFAQGIGLELGACFLWGLTFIIPQFIEGFSSIEIGLGRYLIYGLISFVVFLYKRSNGLCLYSFSVWSRAFWISLGATIGSYIFVLLSIRYGSAQVCALILGSSPVTIALIGSWRSNERSMKSLGISSLFILIGIVMVNFSSSRVELEHLQRNQFLGLGFAFCALIAWTWYVVANSKFLNTHREIQMHDWGLMVGVCTLAWVLIFAAVFHSQIGDFSRFSGRRDVGVFLLGISILAVPCTSIALSLWNKASLKLPVSLMGQLSVFQTIFALIFAYILSQNLPSILQVIGVLLSISGVCYGISCRKKK